MKVAAARSKALARAINRAIGDIISQALSGVRSLRLSGRKAIGIPAIAATDTTGTGVIIPAVVPALPGLLATRGKLRLRRRGLLAETIQSVAIRCTLRTCLAPATLIHRARKSASALARSCLCALEAKARLARAASSTSRT